MELARRKTSVSLHKLFQRDIFIELRPLVVLIFLIDLRELREACRICLLLLIRRASGMRCRRSRCGRGIGDGIGADLALYAAAHAHDAADARACRCCSLGERIYRSRRTYRPRERRCTGYHRSTRRRDAVYGLALLIDPDDLISCNLLCRHPHGKDLFLLVHQLQHLPIEPSYLLVQDHIVLPVQLQCRDQIEMPDDQYDDQYGYRNQYDGKDD